jgi:hypothetical protein
MKKTILLLTALASLTIANVNAETYDQRLRHVKQIISEARSSGFSDEQIKSCLTAHLPWDHRSKTFVYTGKDGVAYDVSPNTRGQSTGWQYLNPDYSIFGYRDRNGVLHTFQADMGRYNHSTNDYQVLINGHWLSVGVDIFKLN